MKHYNPEFEIPAENPVPTQVPPHEVLIPVDLEKKTDARLKLAETTIERSGLFDDVNAMLNSLAEISKVINDGDTGYVKMLIPIALAEPFQTYEGYMLSKYPGQELSEYVIEHSDKGKVARFNALVGIANALRREILGIPSTPEDEDVQLVQEKERPDGIIDPDQDSDPQISALRFLLIVREELMKLVHEHLHGDAQKA